MKIYINEMSDFDDYERMGVFLVPDDFNEEKMMEEVFRRNPQHYRHITSYQLAQIAMVMHDLGYEELEEI